MRYTFFLWLLLWQTNIIFAQVGKPFPDVELWTTSEGHLGDFVKSTSLLEQSKRTFVFFFATWCPPSIAEVDYFYEKGLVDSCKAHGINIILITDKYLPFRFNGRKPKGDWPDRLTKDFKICIDEKFQFLDSIKGEKSFPFGCIVETDGLLSYCYSGFSEEKIDALIRRLSSTHLELCNNCNGTGINPKACTLCKGTGRCMICYNDPDYYLHHCNSCDNTRICSICHNIENKRKQCAKCFGTGYK